MKKQNTSQFGRYATCILTLCIVVTLVEDVRAQEETALRYTTPSDITCVVTEHGLSSIKTPQGTLADGSWQLKGVGKWAKDPRIPSVTPPEISPGPVQERSLTVLDEHKARVRHVHKNVAVTYEYVFDGEDLRITARVKNDHKEADLRAARFAGMQFNFRTPPDGVMSVYTEEEVNELGFDAFHPSQQNPIGGSFAATDDIGIGVAPVHTGSFPDLLSWQLKQDGQHAGFRLSWAGPRLLWWEPGENPHDYAFHYVASSTVKAEGARTFRLIMRFSDNTAWKHLLTPWKRELAAAYGEVRYDSSARPIAYHPVKTQPAKPAEGSGNTMWNDVPGAFGEVAEEDKDNPLGYAADEVRFDRSEAVEKYVDRMLPALKEANARGMIFRQIGGHDPKGLKYGAMFHMAPDRVHENIRNLITDRLTETDKLVGLAGRPGRWPIYTTTDRCEWVPLDPSVPKQLEHMWSCRFALTSIRKIGAKMFLLEDFGDSREDVRIMRYLRQAMKKGSKTGDEEGPFYSFAAYPSDAMLFFTPGYTPVRQNDDELVSRLGWKQWRILRWLVPGSSLYGLIDAKDSAVVQAAADKLYTRGIGAIVYDKVLPDVASELGNAYAENSENEAFAPAQKAKPLQLSPSESEHLENSNGSSKGELTYATDKGIEFLVTADGLQKITLGDRVLAEGDWKTLSPSGQFGDNPIRQKSFRKTGPRSCRVIHTHEDIRTVFDYAFLGEDLTIRARVENNHTRAGINICTFGKLNFHFRGTPDKTQWSTHSKWGYLPHVDPTRNLGGTKLGHMYPSRSIRIAGCYGADEDYGVGITPLRTGLTRTRFHWKGNWGSEDRLMTYSAQKPIPAGGARTFYMKMRLSPDKDWRHLLTPYRQYFRKLHGLEARYNINHRVVGQRMVAEPDGDHWKTKESPLAYHQKRRLDTPEGAESWARRAVDIMNKVEGKGIIMWAQCGYQPRKMHFRTDFDLLPDPVKKSWPRFRKVFEEAGQRFGVTVGRTFAINYRWKWNKDNIPPRGDGPAYLQAMAQRFRRMMDRGTTMFYLDMFGYRLKDIKAMRYYREEVLGPDVLTYAEGPMTDAILPYSGLRTGLRHSKKKGLHLHWNQDRAFYIMQWVMDDFGSQNLCRLKPAPKIRVKVGEKMGEPIYEMIKIPKETQLRWMFRRRMGVLDLPHVMAGHAETYRKLQDEFLTEDGKWKANLGKIPHPGDNQYRRKLKKEHLEKQEKSEEEKLDDLMDEAVEE